MGKHKCHVPFYSKFGVEYNVKLRLHMYKQEATLPAVQEEALLQETPTFRWGRIQNKSYPAACCEFTQLGIMELSVANFRQFLLFVVSL